MTATEGARQLLAQFAADVRADIQANPSTTGEGAGYELLLAPRFRTLVERLLPIALEALPVLPRVLPEYERGGVGRPDLAFVAPPQRASAFIELKAPDKSIDPSRLRGHDREQFIRFCDLPVWALSNFHSIQLYERGQATGERCSIIPRSAINPDTSDQAAARAIGRHDPSPFLLLLSILGLARAPAPANAKEAAEILAHAARLIRHIVHELVKDLPRPTNVGQASPIVQVREEFRDVLFSRPPIAGHASTNEEERDRRFNHLFAGAFGQTLAFGLLLAREASGNEPVTATADALLPEGTYPLLRVTLQALLMHQVADELGAGLDTLLNSVNSISPKLLSRQYGEDPILYFYEDFLAVFDPDDRRRYGVYFTPVPVVRYMVAALHRVLNEGMGTGGLLDDQVLILDPACGTGTFLIAAASTAADLARDRFGDGAIPAQLRSLTRRLHGFEILVGPYAVAHYRLHRELKEAGARLNGRLPIYLADTLTPPGDARGVVGHIPFIDAPIVEERRLADTVKSTTPIIAIIANPPYRRLRAREIDELVGPWMNAMWNDLKQPVRDAGWGLELNAFPDLYVAFYRWSLWKLFEAEGSTGRGALCLITNRSLLSGHTFAGLRRMLRQRFSHLNILDLRGDSQGALPPGVGSDENVFEIQVGVCILLGWVAERPVRQVGSEAYVRYADVFAHGAFTREDKFALLNRARTNPDALTFHDVQGRGLDDFLPTQRDFHSWVSLTQMFLFRTNGIVTYRDRFSYAFSPEELAARVQTFLTMPPEQATEAFGDSAHNNATRAQTVAFQTNLIQPIAYRPFDVRYLYAHRYYVDRLRNHLQRSWGDTNVAIFAQGRGTGTGPAVWVHGFKPDQHAFRGSYGGFVFPLYDANPASTGSFINPALINGLQRLYSRTVSSDEVFDCAVCLLSAPAYTLRFGTALANSFPRVPFPANAELFLQAAEIGASIRSIETFARAPLQEFSTVRIEGRASAQTLDLPALGSAFQPSDGEGSVLLRADASQRLQGISREVWDFEVSGYQVLWRWLEHRRGQQMDIEFYRNLQDVAGRIAELCAVLERADAILTETLQRPVIADDLLPQAVSASDVAAEGSP